LLSQAERRLTRQLAHALEEEGCSVDLWRILVLLADGGGHSMSEIAEFALLPAPSLTRLIDRAVADNRAYRKADPGDRRRVLVHLTARGRALHRRLEQRIKQEQEAILADATSADLEQLAALLTDLVERLR
jgi:DNA-binding MarR family transcriptional regulator